ncbi:MAG: isochorismatase family cysteine hydrolase [Nocardioidaceae bacterium]
MANFSLVPARTALVDVDMQRCFVEGSPLASPQGPVVLQRINQLIAACRDAGALVVHTRGWMRPGGSNLGVMGELVPPFIIDLYTEGSEYAELHPALDVQPSDVVVSKPRYGGFHGTDLELVLRSSGVETVIVSGIATNICCETTAREAAQRDFRVVFLSDGTATKEMNGVPAADLQRATCASLGMVFAQIARVDEVITKLAVGGRTPTPTGVSA